ncbi:hypothetical protein Droror1_Dr00025552 [Drosera rotundifolia]
MNWFRFLTPKCSSPKFAYINARCSIKCLAETPYTHLILLGMGDSKEFAGELFDTLARRRNINAANRITVDEMRKFWEDMTSQDIDARLQIFFDMCDKNGDGKLSEDEVRKIWQLETLLRGMVGTSEGSTKLKRTHSLTKTMIPMSYRHPVMKTMSTTAEFIHENWKRIWMVALWVVINVLLFTYKFVQYSHKAALQVMGYWVCVAKGAA